MYCKHCGKEIDDNSKFCQHCGKSLGSDTITYFEYIKTFISSNKKKVKIVIGILICIAIGWLWYINTPSYKIVGEWQREIRIGTEVEIYNSDGTFENKLLSPGFGDTNIKGEWSIFGSIITKSFGWEGKKYFDKYEIIKLNSDEFVFKHVKESRERHFNRTK